MKYEVVIKADTNDADYVTKTSTLDEAQLEELKSILAIIKTVKAPYGYNWTTGDISSREACPEEIYKDLLTSEQIEWFGDLVPSGEYGIHTIESVVYYPLPEKVTIFP